MARYRKVDVRIWNDAKFADLDDHGKLLFLFLLTHPHCTSLGGFRATIPGLSAELGWLVPKFRKAMASLIESGLVEHDEKAAFVMLPNFLKYNPPDNPNVVTGWASALDLMPECQLKSSLIERARSVSAAAGESFSKAFAKSFTTLSQTVSKPFGDGLPNQEQEQEQKQEQEQEVKRGGSAECSESKEALLTEIEADIVAAWNATEGLPRIKAMSPDRRKLLKARLAERTFAEGWRESLDKIAKSPFCRGENERQWRADIDWFLKQGTIIRILEGKFDDRKNAQSRPKVLPLSRKH